ncbi:MAG: HopJ type III effector protein [Gilvibacter sp.]
MELVLLLQLRLATDSIDFQEVIALIDQTYTYTPTRFANGTVINQAGTNEGSCKIFYFAKLQKLTENQTLALFGSYYRDDVLANPMGEDHDNIRHFIKSGWSGFKFDGVPLT